VNSISPRASIVFVPREVPAGIGLIDFLAGHFPHIGEATWTSRIGEGKVRLGDGSGASELTKVSPGMEIRYFREVSAEPRVSDLHRILYRDDHILVACKPHFLPVVPGGKFVRECLLYHLMEETGLRGLTPVHRIDRHTAGLVLFSIHENERGRYHDLFKDRQVEKGYLAHVRWLLEPPAEESWELEARIERYGSTLRRDLVEGVPNSFCRVSLLERSGSFAGLALNPSTGKRHQLRLQVSQIGASILNDPDYPDRLPEGPDDPARPLQLLSKSLRFRDPFTQREMEFTSSRSLLPLP